MIKPTDFGIKDAILSYLTPTTPLVPPDYAPEPVHISTGSFSVGLLGFCARKDMYDRVRKLDLPLSFDVEPFPQSALWRMNMGKYVEQCIVYPALRVAYADYYIETQGSLYVKEHERRTLIDFILPDSTFLEVKTQQAKSWDWAKRQKRPSWQAFQLVQPLYAHIHADRAIKEPYCRLLLMAYDVFPMIDEYIIEPPFIYNCVNGAVREHRLPPEVMPDALDAEAARRLELWRKEELPEAKPVYNWECKYCSYAEGCKKNLNITA